MSIGDGGFTQGTVGTSLVPPPAGSNEGISDGGPASDQAVGKGVPGPADTPVFNR